MARRQRSFYHRPMRLRPSHVLLASIALAGCEKPARVELDPPSLRFSARGQTAKVHATPYDQRGKPLPDLVCKWSSTDDHVATAAGPHNEATVAATGPGAAGVRCAVEGLVAEARVAVRLVSRIAVDPARLDLQVKDTPEPFALRVDAFDDAGGLVAGKTAAVRCERGGLPWRSAWAGMAGRRRRHTRGGRGGRRPGRGARARRRRAERRPEAPVGPRGPDGRVREARPRPREGREGCCREDKVAKGPAVEASPERAGCRGAAHASERPPGTIGPLPCPAARRAPCNLTGAGWSP